VNVNISFGIALSDCYFEFYYRMMNETHGQDT